MNNKLWPREREVLRWVALGYTSSEIAASLHLSPRTVENYRLGGMQKLRFNHRYQVVEWYMRQNENITVININNDNYPIDPDTVSVCLGV